MKFTQTSKFAGICLGALTLALLAWAAPLFAQEAAQPSAGGEVAAPSKTLFAMFHEGGWIMYPLAGISIWCMALLIECFIRIRLPNFAPPDLLSPLRQTFAEQNYHEAWRICKSRNSFLTNVLRHGIERIGRGRVLTEQAIMEHSLKEGMVFRTKISYLSSIGVVSPMVGLLGTVTGMIKAFNTLGTGGIGDPSKLAAAIGEVLIATATGLIIAIPAFFAYYFFRNKLQSVIVLAEDIMNQLLLDVNYDELKDLKIGEAMEMELQTGALRAPPPGGGPAPFPPSGEARVSQAITGVTVNCPQCSAPIQAGAPKCGACGTDLQWT